MRRICRMPHIARKYTLINAHSANRLGVIGEFELLERTDKSVINEFNPSSVGCCFLHLTYLHMNWSNHGMSDYDLTNTMSMCFLNQQENFF